MDLHDPQEMELAKKLGFLEQGAEIAGSVTDVSTGEAVGEDRADVSAPREAPPAEPGEVGEIAGSDGEGAEPKPAAPPPEVEEPTDKPTGGKSASERIRELVAERKAAEQQAAQAQEQLGLMQARLTAAEEIARRNQGAQPATGEETKPAEKPKGPPLLSDYVSDETGDYDHAKWAADTQAYFQNLVNDTTEARIAENRQRDMAVRQFEEASTRFNDAERALMQSLPEGGKAYEAAQEAVTNVLVNFSQNQETQERLYAAFMEAVLPSDVGPKIIMDLGADPEGFQRAVAGGPMSLYRAIGAAEARARAQQTTRAPAPPPKVQLTRAPAPPPQAPAGGAPPSGELRDDMSFDEYKAARGLDDLGYGKPRR